MPCLANPDLRSYEAVELAKIPPNLKQDADNAKAALRTAEENQASARRLASESNFMGPNQVAYEAAMAAYNAAYTASTEANSRYENRRIEAMLAAQAAWQRDLTAYFAQPEDCGRTIFRSRGVGSTDSAVLRNSRGSRVWSGPADLSWEGDAYLVGTLPPGSYTFTLKRDAVPSKWVCSKYYKHVCKWAKRRKSKTATIKFTWNGQSVSVRKAKVKYK